MSQYPSSQNEPRRFDNDVRRADTEVRQPGVFSSTNVASPAPLGLGIIGIITAILGCFYTGFITPFQGAGVRPAVGAASLILGIVLVLAGMWEFRKNYLMTATLFTAYGGILAFLGLVFLPNTGIAAVMGGNAHLLMGLVFLCWTIYLGILCIGAVRTNTSLAATLVLLFISFLFLMLGSLASNSVLLKVGGWVAIVTALVAWIASVASVLGTETPHELFHVPLGHRMAIVE